MDYTKFILLHILTTSIQNLQDICLVMIVSDSVALAIFSSLSAATPSLAHRRRCLRLQEKTIGK